MSRRESSIRVTITFESSLTTVQLMLPESADFIIQDLFFPCEPLPEVLYLTFCIVVRLLECFQVPLGFLQELSLILAPGSDVIYDRSCETRISKDVIRWRHGQN